MRHSSPAVKPISVGKSGRKRGRTTSGETPNGQVNCIRGIGRVNADLLTLLKRHWGYASFLPGQAEAVTHIMGRQDSLVVLPTGAGKSLCYQLPALAQPGVALVISPLKALMKDQVDGLLENDVSAGTLHSGQTPVERQDVFRRLKAGSLKLLYLAPEGLLGLETIIRELDVSFVAVDEAHLISHWGHEYREDYRNISQLRAWMPSIPIHAFTATATERVRDDIVANLRMRDAQRVVGDFERTNLYYRVVFRHDLNAQLEAIFREHRDEAGIIYCISRKEVDRLALSLQKKRHKVLPYHAGLSDEVRQRNQEAFSNEKVNIIVATVAFGMGIDRTDVRFVIHAGLPGSIEAYQQEAGRAGRDGLRAECILLHSGQDVVLRKAIIGLPQDEHKQLAHKRLEDMHRFARTLQCRHRVLVTHFGQDYTKANCGHCDVCCGEHEELADSFITAQKILSCVARVKDSFGAQHVAQVLKGAKGQRITQWQHDELSTYGLLGQYQLNDILDWIDQLIAQGFLVRAGEYQTLQRTAAGNAVLKGQGTVRLSAPRITVKTDSKGLAGGDPLTAEEQTVWQRVRAWRADLARERKLPPYVIFNDKTLDELVRRRPDSEDALLQVPGIGEKKLNDFGEALLRVLAAG